MRSCKSINKASPSMNPMSKQTRNGTPSMEKTQSIESWQKTGRSSETGTGQRFLTIVRHQTEELDNLIKFKKIKTIKFFIFLNIYEKSSCYLKCLIRFLIVSTIIRMITQKRNKTMWYSSSCFQFYKTAEIQC